jgi:hypothetical protein
MGRFTLFLDSLILLALVDVRHHFLVDLFSYDFSDVGIVSLVLVLFQDLHSSPIFINWTIMT